MICSRATYSPARAASSSGSRARITPGCDPGSGVAAAVKHGGLGLAHGALSEPLSTTTRYSAGAPWTVTTDPFGGLRTGERAELHADSLLTLAGPWDDDSGAMLVCHTDRDGVRDIIAADTYYAIPGVRVVSCALRANTG